MPRYSLLMATPAEQAQRAADLHVPRRALFGLRCRRCGERWRGGREFGTCVDRARLIRELQAHVDRAREIRAESLRYLPVPPKPRTLPANPVAGNSGSDDEDTAKYPILKWRHAPLRELVSV